MRKTKVTGFSLPVETYQKVEKTLKESNKTKSEFFRQLLDFYFEFQEHPGFLPGYSLRVVPSDRDLASVLRQYWEIKSELEKKVIIVVLGIIFWKGQVLIGARNKKDHWVKNLTWVFPGGQARTLDFDQELRREVKEETGLEVRVKDLVATRIHPDGSFQSVQIVAFYFYCQPVGKIKPVPKGDLSKLKWVKPTEVFRYFTTSTCDEVTKFLSTLEKSSF